MPNYYLAIDIGASSGRHMLFWRENETMQMEEIYRFPNGVSEKSGHLCWDYSALEHHILAGMKRCAELGKIPVSVGIDTWGVDFVLLDENDRIIGDTVSYRDHRTAGMEEVLSSLIPPQTLYTQTGIQKAVYNTIYQLLAVKREQPQDLEKAVAFLMVPDYFHWRLCGKKANEYTEASTTQLLDPHTRDWNWALIRQLGLPETIFQPVQKPGTLLGTLTEEIANVVGYRCNVVLPATHDTASAILAMPSNSPDALYISSGTWSLLGVEKDMPDCSVESQLNNFTNEGGYGGKICYLKNIMGLWIIQSVKKELEAEGVRFSFDDLCDLAEACDIPSLVSCNDDRFLAPDGMIREIQAACQDSGQPVPQTPGELSRVVYRSLASCYADAVDQLRERHQKDYRVISVLGGGSRADYLNRLTAKETGCTVYAGPGEATAIGNAIAQMLENREWATPKEARDCVLSSFGIEIFQP